VPAARTTDRDIKDAREPPFGAPLPFGWLAVLAIPIGQYAWSLLLGGADAQLQPALHMALTVRDMRVSADWYQRVLGFEFVKGIPGRTR
jgi:hypothetical protein